MSILKVLVGIAAAGTTGIGGTYIVKEYILPKDQESQVETTDSEQRKEADEGEKAQDIESSAAETPKGR